jgi:uncharacterized delta-60 repeat protein
MNLRFPSTGVVLRFSILAFVLILTVVVPEIPIRRVNSTSIGKPSAPPSVGIENDQFGKEPATLDSPSAMAGGLCCEWTTDFSSSDRANAVAVQTDGKIVVAGTVTLVGGDTNVPGGGSSFAGYDFAVFRYNADGSLDTSFGGDGKVSVSMGDDFGSNESANAIAIQGDGKIIVGGNVIINNRGNFALVRLNTDGSIDSTFGFDGKVVTDAVPGGIVDLALQTDGKILAVGGDGFALARYNNNGSLDSSFGTGGIIQLGADLAANSVAVQANGSIIVAGKAVQCVDNGDSEPPTCFDTLLLLRYNENGSQDTTFNTSSPAGAATAVAAQADGKIVTIFNSFNIARFNQDGSLDTSFDGDGTATINVGSDGYINALVIRPDGKIVVAGSSGGAVSDFALARLNANGSPDTSFDDDGRLTTDFDGSSEEVTAVAIQADGKIVAAGYTGQHGYGFHAFDFALSRYGADGSLDPAFDGDGKLTSSFLVVSSAANAILPSGLHESILFGYANNGLNDDFAVAKDGEGSGFVGKMITPIGSGDDRANAAARDGNARYVAAGYSDNGSNRDFALVRYHFWGGVDTSFGQNGKVVTDFGGNDEATAVVVQADNKILVAGQTSLNGGADLIVARFHENGSLDTSFGTGGSVIVTGIQKARALTILPIGKIIVAGSKPNTQPTLGDDFAIARLHQDGSLDTTFDGDGIAVTRFDHSSQINAVVLQPGGKVVAAGYTRNSGGTAASFALGRYNWDGSPDLTFGTGGKVITQFGQWSEANDVVSQSNGKLIAVGVDVHGTTGRNFAFARYNPNGSPDITYGTNGKRTTDFAGGEDSAFAARIRGDGFIIAAGSAGRGARFDFAKASHWGDPATPEHSTLFDYDGDQRAEFSVWNPLNQTWYLQHYGQGYTQHTVMTWGASGDQPVPADYDGDRKTDIAVFRPSEGRWYIVMSQTGAFRTFNWGQAGDLPAPADHDGDGSADLVLFRPSAGVWYVMHANGTILQKQFGIAEDKPVIGDYDGDGLFDIAVYRPWNYTWYMQQSSEGFRVRTWGEAGDIPVPADYDGDGVTNIAIFRPSTGKWYQIMNTGWLTEIKWGEPGDIPTPADYHGDTRADLAVFRPSEGKWYVLNGYGGFIHTSTFGQAGDIPTPSAYMY